MINKYVVLDILFSSVRNINFSRIRFSWPVHSPFRRGFIVTTYLIRAVHGTLAGALVQADHLFAIRVTSAQIATLLLPFLVRLAVLFISIPLYAMATLQVVPDHLLATKEKKKTKKTKRREQKRQKDHLLAIRLAGVRSATLPPLLVRLAVLHLSTNWESGVCRHKTIKSQDAMYVQLLIT